MIDISWKHRKIKHFTSEKWLVLKLVQRIRYKGEKPSVYELNFKDIY